MVSEEMKDLYLKDDVYKEYVISFPEDPELRDLTNADLVEESIELIQSICSQNTFQFGLYEANQLSFKTIGVGNIKGKRIRLLQRIGEYEHDYGIFQIHSCKREDNSLIRDIVAYSENAEILESDVSELVNDMFQKHTTNGDSETIEVGKNLWKYRKNTVYELKRKLAEFVPSLSFEEERIAPAWDEETEVMAVSALKPGEVSIGPVRYEYTHAIYRAELDMNEYYRLSHTKLDAEAEKILAVYDQEGISHFKSYSMTIEEPCEEAGDPHPIQDVYTGADILTVHVIRKVELVVYEEVGMEVHSNKLLYENAEPIDTLVEVYKQNLSPVEYEQFTEEIASVSARNVIRSIYELQGEFPMRQGKVIAINEEHYPESLCYSFMEEEYRTGIYGRICAERRIDTSVDEKDRENPLVYYEWDADAPNTYYMLDNFILKSIILPAGNNSEDVGTDKITLRKILIGMSERLMNLSFVPFTLKCKGLPYVMPGDRIIVEREEGGFESVILERTLTGMQFLTDVFQNNIEEIAQKTAFENSVNITNIVNNSSGSGGGKYEAISVPDLQKILV